MTFMPTEDLASALAGYGRKTNPYDARRKAGLQLLQQGSDTSPILSPWQGAGRLAQAIAGSLDLYTADRDEKAAEKKRSDALAQAMAEPDPQKRIGLLAAYDPDVGSRTAGQLAVEQAKLQQQTGQLAGIGQRYGMPGGQTATGGPTQLPQGTPAPGGFANNAGNIRTTQAAWPGEGAPQNGFKTFATPQDGVNAMVRNYQAYVQQNPGLTVGQALQKWAPPNENDSYGYLRTITEGTGINPGMPLAELMKDPAAFAQFLEAQTRLEKGGVPQGFTPDHFSNATQPPSGPQPGGLQINMPGPGAPGPMPVGGAAPPNASGQGADGMPPQPTPQGVSGPAVVAPQQPPAPPQKVSVYNAPREFLAPYVQKLMQGGFGLNPAEAEQRMLAAAQADLDRGYENDKALYEQKYGDYKFQRDQGAQDQQNTVQNEAKMREQFDQLQPVKDYRKANSVFRSAVQGSAANTPAGDLNMIYAFSTLMDPGSVVREGEMSMVKGTQTVGDLVKSLSSYVEGGSRLSPKARAELLDMMQSRHESYKLAYDDLGKTFRGIAERSRLNPENVVVPHPEVEWKRERSGKPAGGLQNGSGTLSTPAGNVTIQRVP